MWFICSIFFAAALVEPQLNSVESYHYISISNAPVVKAEPFSTEAPYVWQYYPRFSSLRGMAVKGLNISLVDCIKGKAFESPTIRTEDMMWLAEAWNERCTCTRGLATDGFHFTLSPITARETLTNPYSSGTTPLLITKDIEPQMVAVETDRLPSGRDMIELLGGDYTDPMQVDFTNAPPIPSSSPIEAYDFRRLIAILDKYSDSQKVISPNLGYDCYFCTQDESHDYSYEGGYATYTYEHHIDLHTTSRTERTNYVHYIANGIEDWWENDTKKTRWYHTSSWVGDDTKGRYSALSGGNIYLEETTDEGITSDSTIYAVPNIGSNLVARGGFNRLSLTDGASAVHVFECKYYDELDPTGSLDPIVTDETKWVLLAERPTKEGVLVDEAFTNSIPEWVSTYAPEIGDYAFESGIDFSSVAAQAWAVAFPSIAYKQKEGFADPPEKTYADADEGAKKYGGNIYSYSSRFTSHRVLYYGIFEGCFRYNFRTKGAKQ